MQVMLQCFDTGNWHWHQNVIILIFKVKMWPKPQD